MILVTGVAGFIGFSLAHRLLAEGEAVYGIDNLNDYYDIRLKKARLDQLLPHSNFTFEKLDLSDRNRMHRLFEENTFDCVVHLAAQAGVRYSLENPIAYADSNLIGFLNIIEGCRQASISHLIFASSSSVYGANCKIPFSIDDRVDHPLSLYAATKKSNELMAYAYSHLYKIPMTGLRFFTVYGPWGRPDMAYFKFVDSIANNRPIKVYNHGQMKRDFTYIDDVVEGIVRVMKYPPNGSNSELSERIGSSVPYKLYNIGNQSPVSLMNFIQVIEQAWGKEVEKEMLPMQPGDVPITYADVDDLMNDVGFRPEISIEDGISRFVQWYLNYYQDMLV